VSVPFDDKQSQPGVLDGDIDAFLVSFLRHSTRERQA